MLGNAVWPSAHPRYGKRIVRHLRFLRFVHAVRASTEDDPAIHAQGVIAEVGITRETMLIAAAGAG